MPAEQSAEFKKAAEDVKKFTSKPSDNDLLKLYGLFKQGTQDPPFADAPAPGTFDFKGKAKYKAWKEIADAGTTPEEAQKQYVEFVEELAKTHT